MNTLFFITKFADTRKQGSELAYNTIFKGDLNDKNTPKIFYTDLVGVDWVFYPGTSCVIIPEVFNTEKELFHFLTYKAPSDLNIEISKKGPYFYLSNPDDYLTPDFVSLYKGTNTGVNFFTLSIP